MDIHSQNKNYSTKIFIAVLIFAIGFVVGNFSPIIAANVAAKQVAEKVDIKTFWKVWGILDDEFVTTKHRDPMSSDENRVSTSTASSTAIDSNLSIDEKRLYGAIKGMVDAEGDPYTTFFTPSEASSFETEIKGSFGGVGMEVGKKDDVITVISPIPGSPAEKAGLKAGDKILKIDSTVTSDMTIDAAVQLIRGEKGTTVNLTIYREGKDKPLEFKVVRDIVELPTITKTLENGIYTIKIYSFSEQVSGLFKQAIQEFKTTGSKKLIIDLRGNPGGYLDAAVDIASYFVPQGKVVVSQDYGKKRDAEYMRSVGYGLVGSDTKVVVLVDGGSASASEILAGALQDYNLATLVGQKTFGKGSVQEYIKITPTTGLKVTIARWLTPLGRSISVDGLTPNVEVKNTVDSNGKVIDTQLQKAVEILGK
ncbi:MAG: S41 family peptidase [Patescibacteria group bacterium]